MRTPYRPTPSCGSRSGPVVLFWEVGAITQTSYRNWLWFIPSSRPVADCVSCAWTRRAFRCGGRCEPDGPGCHRRWWDRACELYRETIQLGLSQVRNAMGIWQDLVDVHGFADGYQSVKRFVRKLRGMRSPEARVVIETWPGEELQVDYGSGPMVRDPQSGRYRRTRMFVPTLGYSRKSVRLLSFRSSTSDPRLLDALRALGSRWLC
jgi:hypothetical protein